MVAISDITNYSEHVLQEIPEITKYFVVVDDSQLSKEVGSISKEDNLVLVGFIPSHKIEGDSADNAQPIDYSIWMILTKTTRSDGQAAFLEAMARCQAAAKELVKLMLTDRSPIDNACGLMRKLQVPTITVDPIWSLNGCDGYEINYQIKSRLF